MTAAADTPLMTWRDLLSRPRPHADAAVRYGPVANQVRDVWRPAVRIPRGTGVMVHGGCWTTSIADRTLMDWIADDLRRGGVPVWNIDYRGVDRPGGGYPGTFADVAAAADAHAGDRVALHVVDHTGHVELIAPDSAAWAEAKRLILAALPR